MPLESSYCSEVRGLSLVVRHGPLTKRRRKSRGLFASCSGTPNEEPSIIPERLAVRDNLSTVPMAVDFPEQECSALLRRNQQPLEH